MNFRGRVKRIERKIGIEALKNAVIIDDVISYMFWADGKYEGKKVIWDKKFMATMEGTTREAEERVRNSGNLEGEVPQA